MQQGVSSCSSFMFLWFRKRRTSAKCDSSPCRMTDCFRWTNFSNLWMCFHDTRHYIALSIWSHSCNENFLLSFFMLKSVSHPLGVWDKVWRTHTQFTLFLFYKTVFFFRPMLLMLNILIFLPIWGWKYSCVILKFRFRFSMYWVINVPFIELLSSHVKISLLLGLYNKCCLSHQKTKKEMVWYFIGVCIINRTLHGRAEIRNFSSRVEKIFHEWAQRTSEIFFNTRREISYLRAAI